MVERRAAVQCAVYPRPRGGTLSTFTQNRARSGLSPPTRGNLRLTSGERRWRGSIPAHAGEPGAAWRDAVKSGVYPRPRGGTAFAFALTPFIQGLSPPTRGNL